MTFTVERAVKGRKKGKKCSTKRKRGKRCTKYKKLKGSFSRASAAGANSFRFTGKLGGKALRPGSYRLSGLPTGSTGLKGPPSRRASRSFHAERPSRSVGLRPRATPEFAATRP